VLFRLAENRSLQNDNFFHQKNSFEKEIQIWCSFLSLRSQAMAGIKD
jgi:hypothetical protein